MLVILSQARLTDWEQRDAGTDCGHSGEALAPLGKGERGHR